MAGIGFELRRVISQGNLTTSVGATLSGMMVVAGPWLLTIATLFVLGEVFQNIQMPHVGLFQAAAIYAYAVSLSLFSLAHFVFIRLIADLIWLKREREAAGWLVLFELGTAGVSTVVATLGLAWMPLPGVENPLLYRAAAVALFTAVNLLWVAMFFISLLKHYGRILLVYLAGMAASVALVAWWGALWGVGGAVLGFATGHLVIVGALLALCFWEFPPKPVASFGAKLASAIRGFRWLVLAGGLFYLGQWVDKFVFWFSRGQSIEGSWFHLFPPYDYPVYVSGLTILPGLVYFVIVLETAFSSKLQRFANTLGSGPYAHIVKSRFRLARTAHEELRDLALFQAVFTLVALAGVFVFLPEDQWLVFGVGLAGAFFQLLLMVLINLLFYGEFHRQALATVVVFLAVQGLGSALGLAYPLIPGVGFAGATLAGGLTGWCLLRSSLRTIDREIFIHSALPTLNKPD